MLGEHEHGHARVRAPDLGGRDQPVVRVARRHPHVDDRDVRRVRAHLDAGGRRRCPSDRRPRVRRPRAATRCLRAAARCRRRRRCAAVLSCSRILDPVLAVALAGGVHSYLWAPVVSAPGSPTPPTSSEWSTPSPESSPKPTGLSRSMRRSWRSIGSSLGWELGAVWEAGPGDERLRCVRTWHAGEGAPEFEALSERITLAPGEGLPGRVLESGEPVVDRRRPGGRELPAGRRRPTRRAARGVRLPAAQPAGRRRHDGVLHPRAARARRAPAGDDARARQPGRAVRRATARRGGGARQRVAAAGHARGGARRRRDDGPPGPGHRLEPRRRDDVRLPRRRGHRPRDGRH